MFQNIYKWFTNKWEFISNCARKQIERGFFCGYIMRVENVYLEKHNETSYQIKC